MHLSTEAHDCLYVNWAVPVGAAPVLPRPLRYEQHEWQGESWVFATALFFRFVGLRSRLVPLLRLSYPQMSVRLYVLDREGVPSVLFVRMLVPVWVVPVARFLGRQPASAGRFEFPAPSGVVPDGEKQWRVSERGELVVTCRTGSPSPGAGPRLGDFKRTVEYIRRRPRGYVLFDGGVRPVTRQQPSVDVMPMAAEVTRCDLLASIFTGVSSEHWRRPHSAWLCPQIPVSFELGERQILPLAPASRRRMTTVPDSC